MQFQYGKTTYQVTSTEDLSQYSHLAESMKAGGKEPTAYYAGKVLKSGAVSNKQGGMFYRSIKNPDCFVKVF